MIFPQQLLLFIVITTFSMVSTKQYSTNNNTIINLDSYKIHRSNVFRYAIDFRPGHVTVNNGTKILGNFSCVVLKNQQNKEFAYDSVSFSFQCPALHKPTTTQQQQLVQLQITYHHRLTHPQAPYSSVILSFPFIISEYTPTTQNIDSFIKNITKDTVIDMELLIRQPIKGEMIVYSQRVGEKNDVKIGERSVLRMVRKQLRLMGEQQFIKLVKLFQTDIRQQNDNQNDIIQKPQKIYEIKSFLTGENRKNEPRQQEL